MTDCLPNIQKPSRIFLVFSCPSFAQTPFLFPVTSQVAAHSEARNARQRAGQGTSPSRALEPRHLHLPHQRRQHHAHLARPGDIPRAKGRPKRGIPAPDWRSRPLPPAAGRSLAECPGLPWARRRVCRGGPGSAWGWWSPAPRTPTASSWASGKARWAPAPTSSPGATWSSGRSPAPSLPALPFPCPAVP